MFIPGMYIFFFMYNNNNMFFICSDLRLLNVIIFFLFHFWHLAHLRLVSHLEGPLISLSYLTNNTQNKTKYNYLSLRLKNNKLNIRISKISNMSLPVNNKNSKKFCEKKIYIKNRNELIYPFPIN